MPFIIVPVTIVVLGILGFAHAVVYEALITIISMLHPVFLSWDLILTLRVVFILLTLSFTCMTVLSFYSLSIFTKIAYRISALWTGMLMYFFFAGFTYGVLIFINNIFENHSDLISLRSSNVDHSIFISKVGLVLFIMALIVGIYGVFHARTILITRVKVRLPNTPPSWKGKTAVWISDIHLGHVRGVDFMEKIVKKIQALKPAIVFIGGDLYDGVKIDERASIIPLRDLCAKVISDATPHIISDGVYFVMGNHEEFSEKTAVRFMNAVKEIPGLRVLQDEVITVNGVDIVGVDYAHTEKSSDFAVILQRLIKKNTAHPTILLKHEPKDLDIALDAGVDFQISGHTHKGQVFPATLMAKLVFPGFNYGLHERFSKNITAVNKDRKKMLVYTSSGVGTWGPPLRVGTKSEIVLFEFQ